MGVGEASVVIAASSAHRREALEVRGWGACLGQRLLCATAPMGSVQASLKAADPGEAARGVSALHHCAAHTHTHVEVQACHWAIDELKATVPIWKKEFFEGGEVWKENEEWRQQGQQRQQRLWQAAAVPADGGGGSDEQPRLQQQQQPS